MKTPHRSGADRNASTVRRLRLLAVSAPVLAILCGFWFRGSLSSEPAQAARPATPREQRTPEAASTNTGPGPDWHQELDEILLTSLSEPAEFDVRLEDIARRVPAEQLSTALAHVLEPGVQDVRGIDAFAFLVLRRWLESAPAEAAEWATRLRDDAFGRQTFRLIADSWAEQDLASALAWFRRQPETGRKMAARASLASRAADRRDGATALALAADLPPAPERDGLIKYSVLQWAVHDRDGAVAWAKQFPDPLLRAELLGGIAVDWGIQDPPRAAVFANTALPDGPARNRAVADIVRFWGGRSPRQAAAWLGQFPKGDLRGAAMRSLIEVWGRNDAVGAGEWLAGLPSDGARDKALTVYVPTLAALSPDLAAQWAEIVEDSALRERLQDHLADAGPPPP